MNTIYCNTSMAYTLLMRERDAQAVKPKQREEQWRIQFKDCIAVGFRQSVFPQGRNPERIAELLKHLVAQEKLL